MCNLCYLLFLSSFVDKHWPLNYHLVFDLVAVSTIGAGILVLLLPRSIEKKRETNDGFVKSNSDQSPIEDNSIVELVSVTALPEEIDDDSEQNHNLVEVKR